MAIYTDQKLTPGGIWREFTYDTEKHNDVARYVARHPYAWPGGYPLMAITDDGGTLCADCCRKEYWFICRSTPGDGWYTQSILRTGEYDGSITCDNCSEEISAY